MNKLTCVVAALALSSATAMAECIKPDQPQLPDGATASMEDMLAGQKSVKTFQSSNVEYMKCLEDTFKAAEAKVKEGADGTKEAVESAQKTYTEAVEAYNAAVSSEEAVAGQFNTEIREYKAANPG